MPKTVAFGALLEDEVGKMCTRLQREFFNVYSFVHFISCHVVSFHFIHCFVSQQLQLTTISIVYHLPKLVHLFFLAFAYLPTCLSSYLSTHPNGWSSEMFFAILTYRQDVADWALVFGTMIPNQHICHQFESPRALSSDLACSKWISSASQFSHGSPAATKASKATHATRTNIERRN